MDGNGDDFDDGECDGGVDVLDEGGECGGPGADTGFDGDGNCVDAGVCGVADVTVSATSSGATVSYSSNFDVAGFQFDVSGLALAGGSGGAAGDAGFEVQTGGGTVLGFSFDGSTVGAGSGVLTVLSFSGVTSDSTELSMGTFGAISGAGGVEYAASASGSVDHSGSEDCAVVYYGGNVDLGCGCGLARALQPDDEYGYWRCGMKLEICGFRTENLDQVIMNGLDHHLSGRDGSQDL